MLDTVIDLSKQWPQAIAKFGYGSFLLIILLPIDAFSGLNARLGEILIGDGQPVLINVLVFFSIFGFCYLAGSILVSSGKAELINRRPAVLVSLASRVFDTQNGLLIQAFQEARRNSQLFGGALASLFIGGLAFAALRLINGSPRTVFEGYKSIGSTFQKGNFFLVFLGWLIVLLILSYLFRAVRNPTEDRYSSIETEVNLRLQGESET